VLAHVAVYRILAPVSLTSHLNLACRKRIDDAIRWVDKEIRKLIVEIQKLGGSLDTPVLFGDMFAATQQVFEALSGTLKSFEGHACRGLACDTGLCVVTLRFIHAQAL